MTLVLARNGIVPFAVAFVRSSSRASGE